jgi:hypothetical protein
MRFRENFAQFNKDSNNKYANFLRKKSVNKLPGRVRTDYITYLEVNGKLKRVNNVIFQVNDAALISKSKKPEIVYDKESKRVKTTLDLKINPKAENFKYENFDKRIWVNGNYYFKRDLWMQVASRINEKKKGK